LRRQLTEAFGWRDAPRYVLRDRDRVYGNDFIRRIRAMIARNGSASAVNMVSPAVLSSTPAEVRANSRRPATFSSWRMR
jgi:hypothetical protein